MIFCWIVVQFWCWTFNRLQKHMDVVALTKIFRCNGPLQYFCLTIFFHFRRFSCISSENQTRILFYCKFLFSCSCLWSSVELVKNKSNKVRCNKCIQGLVPIISAHTHNVEHITNAFVPITLAKNTERPEMDDHFYWMHRLNEMPLNWHSRLQHKHTLYSIFFSPTYFFQFQTIIL